MNTKLEINNITKLYRSVGVKALNNVSASFNMGEITSIAGENGAGKSTLVKIIFGIVAPDSGNIKLNGKEAHIHSSQDAINYKIGMVFQHFKLVEEFTIAQNIALGRAKKKYIFFTDLEKINKEVQLLIDKYEFKLKATTLVKNLSTSDKQIVEILKMLYREAEILIFDEPTASLSESEAKKLFKTINKLKSKNKCIILITHKLKEIIKLSDKILIFRKGNLVGEYQAKDLTQESLAKLMLGDDTLINHDALHEKLSNRAVLEFKNVTLKKHYQSQPLLNDINFTVHKGEILGFCAVSGNGKGVLEAVLGGMMRVSSGKIIYNSKDITKMQASELRKNGLAFVPSDRNFYGSALQASLSENLIINKRDSLKQKNKIAKKFISKYNIKGLPHQKMGTLSGGNIQKAIVAREIDNMKDYIVFSNPTWGLDINSTNFIHSKILELKKQNKAIILLSSDLDEIIKLSDSINIIFEGKIAKTFNNNIPVSKKEIGKYMLGKGIK